MSPLYWSFAQNATRNRWMSFAVEFYRHIHSPCGPHVIVWSQAFGYKIRNGWTAAARRSP
jgi:hypothetical protein